MAGFILVTFIPIASLGVFSYFKINGIILIWINFFGTTHAFGELLCQYDDLYNHILDWCDHPDFWVRRASAVVLIYPIRKGKLCGFDPFIISDKLMNDKHYLVLKGYGWMLKVLSVANSDHVFQYLIKNKALMPRVSFRYASEKFAVDRKAVLFE